MLARSPNNTGTIVIAAVSGRALAQAARRAGYRARVADFFGDDDAAAFADQVIALPGSLYHGVDAGQMISALRSLAETTGERAILILGSGFERFPDLVDEIASHFPLAGNTGATIRRIKDPVSLAEDCRALNIPHPELRWQDPDDPANWLIKTAGGAGGTHIRSAVGETSAPGRYFQRKIDGDSISALFVADRRRANIVGFSRQWTSPTRQAPYRYGGAVRLRRFPRKDSAQITGWLSALTARSGLVGLCSADFVGNDTGYTLIEINPRPGATLDLFDSEDAPLLEAHIRACDGERFMLPRFNESMASMIAYASKPIAAFPQFDWPEWAADRQSPGSRLAAGDPICTVFAWGENAETARRGAASHLRQLERAWGGGRE